MWFAAKEAHERRVAERRRREGFQERRREELREGFSQGFLDGFRLGRAEAHREERQRIRQALAKHGVELPPEVDRLLFDEPESDADWPAL